MHRCTLYLTILPVGDMSEIDAEQRKVAFAYLEDNGEGFPLYP